MRCPRAHPGKASLWTSLSEAGPAARAPDNASQHEDQHRAPAGAPEGRGRRACCGGGAGSQAGGGVTEGAAAPPRPTCCDGSSLDARSGTA